MFEEIEAKLNYEKNDKMMLLVIELSSKAIRKLLTDRPDLSVGDVLYTFNEGIRNTILVR